MPVGKNDESVHGGTAKNPGVATSGVFLFRFGKVAYASTGFFSLHPVVVHHGQAIYNQ